MFIRHRPEQDDTNLVSRCSVPTILGYFYVFHENCGKNEGLSTATHANNFGCG